jgi:hypothetical protein
MASESTHVDDPAEPLCSRRDGGSLAHATRKGKRASVNFSGRSRFRPRI